MSAGHDDHGHHGPTSFWTKYVFSTDHKVIGIQFLFTSLLFVVLGGLLALGVRYQIAWPQQDVPYAKILPGTGTDPGRYGNSPAMTMLAPEANVALWQNGHEVTVSQNLVAFDGKWMPLGELAAAVKAKEGIEDDDQAASRVSELLKDLPQVPANVKAKLTGFPQGLAVTLPAGTKIISNTGQRALTVPLNAYVDKVDVMAGYKSAEQMAQAISGTEVIEEGADGQPTDRTITVVGRRIMRPTADGAGRPDSEDLALLPVRRAQTQVSLYVPQQTLTVTDAAQLDGFAISNEERRELVKQLEGIVDANTKLRAERDEKLTPLNSQLEKATALFGENSATAKAIQADIDALNESYDKQFQVEEIDAPVAAANVDSISAMAANYTKHALTSDAYSQLFTMHASIMIFFVIIPMLVGSFGNFLIPLMVGARDMAFPKLNMLSYWLAFPAGLIMIVSFWVYFEGGGAAGGGWTMYPTLSEAEFSSNLGTTLWLVSVFLVGFSSIVGSLNYITTTINMRAPGMSMFRMPLTVWSILITSILQTFGTPMLAAAGILLIFDRTLGTTFFDPSRGGQPLLWQHLFWFYSHPAVYIMILPAMGVTSDILSVYARKPIFGYKPMVYAMAGITGLGFIVWGHHMFQSGMNPVLGTTFMASTIMIAVPSAIKTFNWLGTLWGGNIQFTPAMLNALGFVSMFVIGGLSGIFMASAPVDIQIHDTYFIVAHIHYVLFGGSIFGIFAGVYHWFPKMFGRQMNQKWGVIHFWLTIIAFNGTFFLMHVLGVGGHPRRYASLDYYPTLEHLQPMNVFMTICAMMLGAAQLPFFYNFFVSLPRTLGKRVVPAFIIAFCGPIVVGLSFWGLSDQSGVWMTWWAGDPNEGYTGFQQFVGQAALWLSVIGLTISMIKGLPFGGQLTVLLSFLTYLATAVFWDNSTFINIQTAVGFGVIFGFIVYFITSLVWEIGGTFRVPALLQRLLYVVALPAFMAPMILKQDPYLWLGVPGLFAARWGILIAMALPGLAYLIAVRPNDEFGFVIGENPVMANSLEWITTSPPPHLNFDDIPTVHRGPYEYSSPVVEEDYLPQTKILPAGVVEPTGH